jgi:hypothetical protein
MNDLASNGTMIPKGEGERWGRCQHTFKRIIWSLGLVLTPRLRMRNGEAAALGMRIELERKPKRGFSYFVWGKMIEIKE